MPSVIAAQLFPFLQMRFRQIPAVFQFAFIVGLALLPAVFIPEVIGSSEAREAHVALDVASQGNWIVPTRIGEVASKPPLSHWISAACIKLFDLRPLHAQRIVSLLFAILMVISTALLTGCVLDRIQAARSYIASGTLFAAVSLSTSYLFVKLATNARVDMVFAALVSCCIYFFYRDRHTFTSSEESVSIPVPFFLCSGLAVLTKGPLGLVIPGIIVLCAGTVRMGAGKSVWKTIFQPLWLLSLAIPLSWYCLVAYQGGVDLLKRQLFFENVTRFVGGEGISSDPLWYYGPSFVTRGAPWSLLFLFLIAVAGYRKITTGSIFSHAGSKTGSSVISEILLSLVVLLLILSLSTGKRHAYLLPLMPLFVVALTVFGIAWIDRQSDRLRGMVIGLGGRCLPVILAICCFFLVLISVASLLIHDPKLLQSDSVFLALSWLQSVRLEIQLWLLAICLSAVSLKRHLCARESEVKISWFASLALFSLCLTVGTGMKSFLRGHYWAAMEIQRVVQGEGVVVLADLREEELDPVVYYLLESDVELQAQDLLAPRNSGPYFLIKGEAFDKLARNGDLCADGLPVLHLRLGKVKDVKTSRSDRDAVVYRCEVTPPVAQR